MTGVRREWLSGHDFLMIHLDLVDALGGSWEAAGLLARIAYRAGADGWWVATTADMQAECRLTERKARRAITELRDAGMIVSERVNPFQATLRWRLAYAGEQLTPDGHDDRPESDETSGTESDETSASPSSKNGRTEPPADTSGEVPPILSLVAAGDVAEPALFDTAPVETWPAEATANGCRQAWLVAWTEAHGAPDPTIKRRAFGQIKAAAKDRTTLEDWQALWRACHAAGRTGRWNVSELLTPTPASRYPQRTNHYVGIATQAATAGMLDDLLHRPAIGGPA